MSENGLHSDLVHRLIFFLSFIFFRVDPEPPRSNMKKEMRVENTDLVVDFQCNEAKTMRVSVNSFFDLLNLVVQTIDQFAV